MGKELREEDGGEVELIVVRSTCIYIIKSVLAYVLDAVPYQVESFSNVFLFCWAADVERLTNLLVGRSSAAPLPSCRLSISTGTCNRTFLNTQKEKGERVDKERCRFLLATAKIPPHRHFCWPDHSQVLPEPPAWLPKYTSPTMPKKRKSTAITVSAEAVSPLNSSDAATIDTSMLTTIELQEENKRQKAAIASIAGQFLCSIGKKLPLDPVVAEVRDVVKTPCMNAFIFSFMSCDDGTRDKTILLLRSTLFSSSISIIIVIIIITTFRMDARTTVPRFWPTSIVSRRMPSRPPLSSPP